ncbi:MAG: tRNA uridine-5-carboxymethylaminomethyl(34) synthesis GTPase MnmE [Candidatus Bipolaricaulia bacterium]
MHDDTIEPAIGVDTIAAISTPIGEGGIGIVRVSGSGAIPIVDRIFQAADGEPLHESLSHRLHYGKIVVDGRRVDEVLVSVMRAPRTYTRDDVVEVNCHGGIVATRSILDAILAGGARLAERGEFTKRAFLSGRISLDQAKAVLDIVRAKTALGLEAAVDRLGGRFEDAIREVREALAGILAELEAQIDFPDLDVESEEVASRVTALSTRVCDLLARAEEGRILREGLTVAIVGRPNVGKSTLLNALLAEERAIVTPIPGTTRDTVEEETPIGGVPVRLIDTAGLRAPNDPVETEGVRRTEQAVERADLVLLLLDSSEPLAEEDRRLIEKDWEIPTVLLLNKCDLPSRIDEVPDGPWKGSLRISARDGRNLDNLRTTLLDLLLGGRIPARNSVLLLDQWERDLLRRVREGLAKASSALEAERPPDMVAEELRAAYRTSGELQGIDVAESILDAVFARFCVGK